MATEREATKHRFKKKQENLRVVGEKSSDKWYSDE